MTAPDPTHAVLALTMAAAPLVRPGPAPSRRQRAALADAVAAVCRLRGRLAEPVPALSREAAAADLAAALQRAIAAGVHRTEIVMLVNGDDDV